MDGRRRNNVLSQLSLWTSSTLNRKALGEFVPDIGCQPVRPSILRRSKRSEATTRSGSEPATPPVDPKPEISAVLGSYNRSDLLKHAIASLRNELDGLSHEIIVVDGGSSDGTLDWLVAQDDIITIIQHNRYTAGGRTRRRMSWGRFMNLGFKGAAGDYVLMISDDCYLLPGSVENALARIRSAQERHVRVGACAFYFRDWPTDDRYYVQRTFGGNLMVNHGIFLREVLKDVGYCDEEEFVFYKADSDLALRIWERGFVIIDSKQSICEHYVGEGGSDTIRSTNNATLDHDRDVLRRRWPQMTPKNVVAKMGRIYLDVDLDRRVDQIWGNISIDA